MDSVQVEKKPFELNAGSDALRLFHAVHVLERLRGGGLEGLRVVMHPAQMQSYEELFWLGWGGEVAAASEVDEWRRELAVVFGEPKLAGIPIVVDAGLAKDVVEFRRGGEVVARIANLAIPAAWTWEWREK